MIRFLTVLGFLLSSNLLTSQIVLNDIFMLKNAGWLGASGTVTVIDYYADLPDDQFYEFIIEYNLTPDGITVFDIGNGKFARMITQNGVYNFQQLGIVKGVLETIYPNLSYSGLSAIRLRNLDSLQSAFSVLTNVTCNGHYQVEPKENDGFNMLDFTNLKLKGTNVKTSIIELYPLHGRMAKVYDFISMGDGCNLEIENITLRAPPLRYESYSAILKVSGDNTKVQITSSLRSDLSISVNDTVFTTYGNTLIGELHKVSSYDSGTKTITLQGNLLGGVPSDQAGNIALIFPDSLSKDTIETYGGFYYDGVYLSTAIKYESAGNTDSSTIILKGVNIDKYNVGVTRSGGHTRMKIIDSYISGHITAISSFNGDHALASQVELINTDIVATGFIGIGYLPPSGTYSSELIWAGGAYVHPNVEVTAINCNFYDNLGATFRQYSSGGHKVFVDGFVSTFVNCEWWNNAEFALMTSQVIPTNLTNCIIRDNPVYPGRNATFSNCYLKDADIIQHTSNEPDGIEGTNFTRFIDSHIENFKFKSSWSRKDTSSIAEFDNCIIQPHVSDNSITDAATQPIRKLVFRDCEIGNYNNSYVTSTGFFASRNIAFSTVIEDSQIDTGVQLIHRASISNDDWNLYSFELNNCIVNQSLGVDNPLAIGGLKGKGTVFNNGVLTSCGTNYFSMKEGQGLADTATINSIEKTVRLDWDKNYYKLEGDITRIIIGSGNGDNQNWTGIFYLEATNDITTTAYSSNSNSNIVTTDTILAGKIGIFMHRPDTVLAGGASNTTGQVLFTGDGIETIFDKYSSGILDANVVPGTVTITAGGVTLTDENKDGILVGSGGVGVIEYHTRKIRVVLDAALGDGVDMTAEFDYYTTVHHQGAIIRIQ